MMLFQAVHIVARQALINAANDMNWEDYPGIGEGDWGAVQKQALNIARGRGEEKADTLFDEAITMLYQRAEGVEV